MIKRIGSVAFIFLAAFVGASIFQPSTDPVAEGTWLFAAMAAAGLVALLALPRQRLAGMAILLMVALYVGTVGGATLGGVMRQSAYLREDVSASVSFGLVPAPEENDVTFPDRYFYRYATAWAFSGGLVGLAVAAILSRRRQDSAVTGVAKRTSAST